MEREPVVCSECAAEADPAVDPADLCNEGWDTEGEFGARCPECVAANSEIGHAVGIKAAAEVAAAAPKLKKRRKKAKEE